MADTNADREHWFDEGNSHLAMGDLNLAANCFRKAVDIDPNFFDGWHALGMTLMRSGSISEAIGAGIMATTLRPNDLLAWTALSQMYVKNRQIPEAEDAKSKSRILSLGGKIVKDTPADQ